MEGEKDDLSDFLELGQKIPTTEKMYFGIGVLANTIIAGVITLYLLDYYINIVKIQVLELHEAKKNKKDNV